MYDLSTVTRTGQLNEKLFFLCFFSRSPAYLLYEIFLVVALRVKKKRVADKKRLGRIKTEGNIFKLKGAPARCPNWQSDELVRARSTF